MDKNKLKENTDQDKRIQKLEDEELAKVSGGLGHESLLRDEDEYYYQGAPDD